MIGWLIALVVLVLIAILPVGAGVCYNEDGLTVSLLFGLIKIKVFPKRSEKKKKKKKKTVSRTAGTHSAVPKKKAGGKVTDFLPFVKIGLDFLNTLRRKIRLSRLELKLTLAGGEPGDLAVKYGKAWAVLGNFMPLLEQVFVIKKRNIEVQCDFASQTTLISARLDITITVARLVGIAVKFGIKALKEFLKYKRKGGTENEQEFTKYARQHH